MKLIAVFCIEEYKREVKKIFIDNNVPVFSGVDIRGFRIPDKSLPNGANWFSDHSEYEHSVLNFAFVNAEQADKMLEAIKQTNQSAEMERPIHAFQMNVEKYVS